MFFPKYTDSSFERSRASFLVYSYWTIHHAYVTKTEDQIRAAKPITFLMNFHETKSIKLYHISKIK